MTEIFKGAGEKLTGIKQETRDKLKSAQEGIKARIEEYRRGATFDLGAFEMDLKKTGATEKGIKWARKKLLESIPPEAVVTDKMKTPEAHALGQFAQDKTKAAADRIAKNPAEALKMKGNIGEWIKSQGGKNKGLIGGAIAALMAYLKGEKNPLKSVFDSLMVTFGLKKPEEKKAQAKPKAKTAKQEQKPQQPKKAPEVAGTDKEIVNEFKKHWPNVVEAKIKSDITMLKESYAVKTDGKLDEAKTLTKIKDTISSASVSTSHLNKIIKSSKEALPGKIFKVRLADIQLQKLNSTDIPKVVAVINNADNKYKLEKTPAKIRGFIDAVNTSSDLDKTIKEQEKTTT